MDTIILGAGLAGLSLASYLDQESLIIEKNESIGGLCRSFSLNQIFYDIGPHILFSKNKTVLNHVTNLIDTNQIKRSNQIMFKNKLIKYPFENDLYHLPEKDRDYCLEAYLNNPYEEKEATNMLDFFLKTFGEGITKLYLEPYNQKIWKYDPKKLDTQMVERIPKPPKEDVIKSAKGIPTEGYTHQLHFHYPKKGGVQALIQAFEKKSKNKINHQNGGKNK